MCPEHLYDEVIEIKERIILQQTNCELEKQCSFFTGINSEVVRALIILSVEAVWIVLII